MAEDQNRIIKTRVSLLQIIIVIVVSATSSASLYPMAGWWVLLVFGVLMATGITVVFVPRIGVLPFSLLTFGTLLPVMLEHNVIGVGLEGTADTVGIMAEVSTPFPFSLLLATGMIMVSGCLLLTFLNSMKAEFLRMEKNRTSDAETVFVTGRRMVEMMRYLFSGISVAVLMVVVLKLIQPVLAKSLEDYPWSIMVLGLPAILVLGALLYGLKTRGAHEIAEV